MNTTSEGLLKRSGVRFILIAGLIMFVVFFVSWLVGFYTDWLWFSQLGFLPVFLKIFQSVWLVRLIGTLLISAFIFINLWFLRGALLVLKNDPEDAERVRFLPLKFGLPLLLFGSLLLGFLLSGLLSSRWFLVEQYLNSTDFGVVDPIFGKDIGFYVFKYPFYRLIHELMLTILLLTGLGTVVFYALARGVSLASGRIAIQPRAKYHISVLTALFFFLKAWDYLLKVYELSYSPRGVVFGASYTDIHANLPALRILLIIAIVCGVLALGNMIFKGMKLFLGAVGLLIIASIALGIIYPALIQRIQVEPNEFAKEKPYIEHNIAYTNKAFGLDKIKEQNFAVTDSLTGAEIQANQKTIDNIRLWDWRPVGQIYNQLQGIRFYYRFEDVDIDRYVINGEERQVMLGARELDTTQLQSNTWINQYLKYTHGYGISLSPTDAVTAEGLPEFLIKDIPPRNSTDIPLTRPEIYFGELTNQYAIVNTKTEEFDYPSGESNAYTFYQGTGGIPLDSILKRLAFSARFGSFRLLISDLITRDSRVLMNRNIQERALKIAPYLLYDGDPYLVVADGKLFWLQDAYTVSKYYPYSEPYNGTYNYIRNSVKVVTDAYNGEISFYIADPSDPIIQTYSKIFPGLYKPLAEMPPSIRPHIRYPLDLFAVQSRMYGIYHMENPAVFYNREDVWNISRETYGGNEQEMVPYYNIMKLPGQEEPEFVLLIPFTPAQKTNMISWLAARSDGNNYGQLVALRFSNQELIYGPMQVEARIEQDAEISQQLTLWSQRGSSVIRGNLLVIPIENSLLYVEPLYIQAEQNELPQLKRIILVYGSRIVMAPTLEEGLSRLFANITVPTEPEPGKEPGENLTTRDLIQQAASFYQQANQAAQSGDWAGYGEALRRLGEVLERLQSAGSQ